MKGATFPAMTTQAAFTELVENPYLWQKAGGSKASRYVYLHRISKGRYPQAATMEAYLERCPHVELVQDKKWKVK